MTQPNAVQERIDELKRRIAHLTGMIEGVKSSLQKAEDELKKWQTVQALDKPAPWVGKPPLPPWPQNK